jgi:hypothetical protein
MSLEGTLLPDRVKFLMTANWSTADYGLVAQHPATKGSEVERRVRPHCHPSDVSEPSLSLFDSREDGRPKTSFG